MFKRQGFKKLGKTASHRKSMMRNLVRSIVERGYLTTTSVKAKVLKSEVESLLKKVSKRAQDNILFRDLEALLGSRKNVDTLLNYLKNEKTGVRVVKVGYRSGDNAQKSKVELIGFTAKKSEVKKNVSKRTSDVKEEVEVKKEKPKGLRGILPTGKSVSKNVTVKRERARTRSGI